MPGTAGAALAVGIAVAATVLLGAGLLNQSVARASVVDLVCGQAASASSNGDSASNAVDCAAGTVWRSGITKPQRAQVDLGSTRTIDHVTVVWGAGYATSYKVRISPDAGRGGTETLPPPPGTGTRWIQLSTPGPGPSGSGSPTPSPSPTASPTPTGPGGRTVPVSTTDQLTAALADVRPGDTISLAAGSYNGAFYATTSGTASAPITLTGPGTAVLSNTGRRCDPNVPAQPSGLSYCGIGLHLNRVSYWRLNGFAVTGALKGIVLDGATHNVITGVQVYGIGNEGNHFRASSADNVLQDSAVHDTGLESAAFGEGLYIGSAQSNWSRYGDNAGSGPDRSDRNQILNNRFGPNVATEHVDIKEGTVDGVVAGNSFDARGISGENFADSWIDVKGSGYTLTGNRGSYSGGTVLTDGYQVPDPVRRRLRQMCSAATTPTSAAPAGTPSTSPTSPAAPPTRMWSTAATPVRNAGKGLTNVPVTGG